jgi:hypothetical protein
MATTATRKTTIGFSGDVVAQHIINAASNSTSPAQLEIRTLASGANTITIPAGGSTSVSCTIHPPSGNTTNITLKGVSGDTGIQLHDTDPSTIALDPSVASFVLTTAAQIIGVRLYWT